MLPPLPGVLSGVSRVVQPVAIGKGVFNQAASFSILASKHARKSTTKDAKVPLESTPTKKLISYSEMMYTARRQVLKRSKLLTNWPPPLPAIADPDLETQVYTHKSIKGRHPYMARDKLVHMHNERLELLGDSITDMLVAAILYDRSPEVSRENLGFIRDSLVSNNIMAEWAILYGMDKKLKHYSPELVRSIRLVTRKGAMTNPPKYIADTFEAYVAGLWLHHGAGSESFKVLRAWFEKLVDPVITALERAKEAAAPLNSNAKGSLYSKIGWAGLSPRYVEIKGGPMDDAVVECRMGSEVLAIGYAKTPQKAGLRAAMKVLQMPKVLRKYADLRRKTPATITGLFQGKAQTKAAADDPSGDNNVRSPLSTHGLSETQVLFIIQHIAEFSNAPKDFLTALMGDKKDSLCFKVTEESSAEATFAVDHDYNEPSLFESTLHIKDIKIGTGSGPSSDHADNEAALNALMQNIDIIDAFLRKK